MFLFYFFLIHFHIFYYCTGVRLATSETLPCHLAMPFSTWFQNTTILKNVVNNFTLYALNDMIFKIEIQIDYGIFIPYEYLFYNTTSVIIQSPSRAVSKVGLSSYPTRPLTPYVSYEQRLVPKHYIFTAVLESSDVWSLPQNIPPQFSAYQSGRGLLSYNVSAYHTDLLVVNTQSTSGGWRDL